MSIHTVAVRLTRPWKTKCQVQVILYFLSVAHVLVEHYHDNNNNKVIKLKQEDNDVYKVDKRL